MEKKEGFVSEGKQGEMGHGDAIGGGGGDELTARSPPPALPPAVRWLAL